MSQDPDGPGLPEWPPWAFKPRETGMLLQQWEIELLAQELDAVRNMPPRLLTQLPRRVRASLAVTRAADRAAIWLTCHGRHGMAMAVWDGMALARAIWRRARRIR